ncbi:AMP-binding protein [Streptomyces rapamycinicus]|uniref:ATP-dependent acyl-CoA ligase n=2 Tax=Streptomyces rapamycinicus TaxID=1226757 RepID=A0A0A0NU52_STRRN|nr:AMP-binding protein [Streptomyces rapamycinicus]AGP61111.1 AMP-dependent synthetase [Streptomyces rapamycinicus NRRL 5491]MBB4787713.1 crotonobetaine/carnitine-CoA ligase [Streptomyces rapamycinicus]RLV72053.1 ATP-dependent acyl-CoA ligase [Streptomyces rapamycinicus NRRL 5491]UTP36623.1 AMP-binding protein [Streptomyces rapamycinicus NRRL 5491]
MTVSTARGNGATGLEGFSDLADGTVGGLLAARAALHPDKPALVFEDSELTYGALDAAVTDVARGLVSAGAAPGGSVGIFLPNRPEYVLAWLGAARAGAVEVPINIAYKGSFLDHALRSTGVRVLVTDAALLELVADLPDVPHTLETVVLLDGDRRRRTPPGVTVRTWNELLAAGDPAAELPRVAPRDPVAIMLTSGTTGRSKGVVHPHLMPLVAARECAAQLATTADERLYTCLPLFHGAAQINISLHAFYAGATVVLGRRFSASRFWDELRTHRVTQFNALGSVLPMLLAQPPSDRDRDHRATKVFAAPAPPQVLHPFEERFGVHVVEGYGLTEIKNVLYNPLDARKAGSLGLPTESSVLEIHDESGQRAAPGRAGEIVYRPRLPDIMFSGYHRDPEATLATMKDLWWHTGDLGYTDQDGYFYFIDRKKDALRRRGENISSHEIESVLLACPGVMAAAAIGTPSELGEDEVLVVVQPEPGHELDFPTLFAHCDHSMPHFMVPRYYRVVDRLPITPNGKVRKHRLRDQGRVGAWDALAAGLAPTRHS